MITWLQEILQKHNKWLLGLLLVVIITIFVLTIGPQSFFGGPKVRSQDRVEFFGTNLNSPAEMERVMTHARISAMLNPEYGFWGPMVQQYALARTAALGLANSMGIPAPEQEALDAFVRDLSAFTDQDGNFDSSRYTQFYDSLQANPQMSAEQVTEVILEDYRITQVVDLMAGEAYALPYALEKAYQQENTVWDVTLLTWELGSFDPEIELSEEQIVTYYEENPADFEEPEKLRARALYFDQGNYASRIAVPSDARIADFFERNQARYREPVPAGEDGVTPPPRQQTLEEAREQVIKDIAAQEARKLALEDADRFITQLFRNKVAKDSPAFEQMIESHQVTVQDVPPFARGSTPNFAIPQNIAQDAFLYTTGDRYYTDAAQNFQGAVVLITDELIPSRLPELAEVRDAVVQGLRDQERRRLFAERGQELHDEINAALAEGQTLSEIAESHNLTLNELEPFATTEAPRDIRGGLLQQLRLTQQGEVTSMSISNDKGRFAYLESKEVPEAEGMSREELLAATTQSQHLASGWGVVMELASRTLQQLEE